MCAKIKICLEKIRKEVFRTGFMFMSNVMSVYFSKVIRRNRGGVSAGLTTLSFVYGLSCALQFCGGKTAVTGREGFGTGSRYLSFVYGLTCALQFCLVKTAVGALTGTDTTLYKTGKDAFFLPFGQKECVLFAFKRIFWSRDFPASRLNARAACGIFPQADLTPGQPAGFSRKQT